MRVMGVIALLGCALVGALRPGEDFGPLLAVQVQGATNAKTIDEDPADDQQDDPSLRDKLGGWANNVGDFANDAAKKTKDLGLHEKAKDMYEKAPEEMQEPTLLGSIGVCIGIMLCMVVNQLWRTLCCTGGNIVQGSFNNWVWPICVVSGLSLNCAWLYNVVLVENSMHTREYAVGIIMSMAIVWWGLTYIYEVRVKKTPLCEDKERYEAKDVYSDMSETMFNVSVRFMMQASMLLILIHVAQDAVASGAPENLPTLRRFTIFGIALTIQLFMFVSCRDHTAWEDLRRLGGVHAVKQVGQRGAEHEIVYVATGDYYIRFAMSVVVTGIFHKFLVLSYPLLVFTTFARDQWVVLLKDILAITIVISLDNLPRSVEFLIFHEATDAVKAEEEDEDDG